MEEKKTFLVVILNALLWPLKLRNRRIYTWYNERNYQKETTMVAIEIAKKTVLSPFAQKAAKLILATLAGFAASQLTEKAFDSVVKDHSNDTVES